MEEFKNNFLNVVKNNYANFNGRARRKEYWQFIAVVMVAYVALAIVSGILSSISSVLGGIILGITGLAMLAILVPMIAVTVRRLHDTGKSGWFILLQLIPFVGALIMLYFTVIEGTRADNEYGPDPKAGEAQ